MLIYIYIYVFIYIYICIFLYLYIRTQMSIHIYLYLICSELKKFKTWISGLDGYKQLIHSHTHAHTHTYTHTHTYIHTHRRKFFATQKKVRADIEECVSASTKIDQVCCRMLQYVAVYCSVLQCLAVCWCQHKNVSGHMEHIY